MPGDNDHWIATLLSSDMGAKFVCGFCGALTATAQRFHYVMADRKVDKNREIRVCLHCRMPTLFYDSNPLASTMGRLQVPAPRSGRVVKHLPATVESAYKEALDSLAAGAATAAALMCRKILMNVAVTKGAAENLKFVQYVDYLTTNHYVPPDSKTWLKHIKDGGNDATHEIPPMGYADAAELVEFTESLLTYVFELPGRMRAKKPSQAAGPSK